jgi:hypothetical protein
MLYWRFSTFFLTIHLHSRDSLLGTEYYSEFVLNQSLDPCLNHHDR